MVLSSLRSTTGQRVPGPALSGRLPPLSAGAEVITTRHRAQDSPKAHGSAHRNPRRRTAGGDRGAEPADAERATEQPGCGFQSGQSRKLPAPCATDRAGRSRPTSQFRSFGMAVRATPERVICVRPVGGQRLLYGVEEQAQYGDRQ